MIAPRSAPPRLPLGDTATTYGRISRALHWGIAALTLWLFLGMGLGRVLGREHILAAAINAPHRAVGLVVFVLVLARLLWALVNLRNRPAYDSDLTGRAARVEHGILYLLMAVVPAGGLLGAYGSIAGLRAFGTTIFPEREEPIGWMVNMGQILHGELAWLLGLVVLAHVAMVLVHDRILRDGALGRMWGPPRGPR